VSSSYHFIGLLSQNQVRRGTDSTGRQRFRSFQFRLKKLILISCGKIVDSKKGNRTHSFGTPKGFHQEGVKQAGRAAISPAPPLIVAALESPDPSISLFARIAELRYTAGTRYNFRSLIRIFRSSRLKPVAKKIKLFVRISPLPKIILAIDDFRLLRMEFQSASLQPFRDGALYFLGLPSVLQCDSALRRAPSVLTTMAFDHSR
jgi:hypothetical protein